MQTPENPHLTEAEYQAALRIAEQIGRAAAAREYDPELREALVPAALVGVHRALTRYQPGIRWEAWATVYARYAVRTEIGLAIERRRLRRAPYLEEQYVDTRPTPEAVVTAEPEEAAPEPEAAVEAALAAMTPRQREIVQRRMAGQTAVEIAAELGITREAVWQCVRVATQRARIKLGLEPAPPRRRPTAAGRARDAAGRLLPGQSGAVLAMVEAAEQLHATGLTWAEVAARVGISARSLQDRRARARQAQERP